MLPAQHTDWPADGSAERIRFRLPLAEKDALRIVTGVDYLAAHSRLHRCYPGGVLERRVEASLALGQFMYFTDAAGVPVAFCNWAWVSEVVLSRVLAKDYDLAPGEFRCGPLPLLYEFLAPFGHCWRVARALREMPAFAGRHIPCIRGRPWGEGPRSPRVHRFRFR